MIRIIQEEKSPAEQKRTAKGSYFRGMKPTLIAEMVFSLLTISVSLAYITEEYNTAADPLVLRTTLSMTFFLTALARLFRARRMRLAGTSRIKYTVQRFYAGVFLVCGILPFFIGYVRAPGVLINYSGDEADLSTKYIGDVRQATGALF